VQHARRIVHSLVREAFRRLRDRVSVTNHSLVLVPFEAFETVDEFHLDTGEAGFH